MKIRLLFLCAFSIIFQIGFTQVENTNVDTSSYIHWVIEAEYPGGYDELKNYLEENKRIKSIPRTQIEYTKEEIQRGQKVIIRFDVDTNGFISNVVVEKGISNCELCNQEALRLVENMPNWIPSQLLGKPLMSCVRLPILFELEPIEFSCETICETEAEFVGGPEALKKYIQKNISIGRQHKKRKSLKQNEMLEGGLVIVRFTIEADGQVSNVWLEQSLPNCEPCNQESIRLILAMPKWIPATMNGKFERADVRIPIWFE